MNFEQLTSDLSSPSYVLRDQPMKKRSFLIFLLLIFLLWILRKGTGLSRAFIHSIKYSYCRLKDAGRTGPCPSLVRVLAQTAGI